MTLNTNPDPRLAPRTPMHSCLERIPPAHVIAFSAQVSPSTTNNLSLDSQASINIATNSCTKEHLHRSQDRIQYP